MPLREGYSGVGLNEYETALSPFSKEVSPFQSGARSQCKADGSYKHRRTELGASEPSLGPKGTRERFRRNYKSFSLKLDEQSSSLLDRDDLVAQISD